jgi:hypothetical protein
MSLSLKEKVSTIFYFVTHPSSLKMMLSLEESGYLKDEGWFRSFDMKQPLDKNGDPIPWFTYPAVEFLKERLNKELNIFEYGCGNSTLFFSERIKEIISVETDFEWYNKIKPKLKSNCSLIFYDEKSADYDYEETIKQFNKKFDIIVVDAIKRNEVIKVSVDYLNTGGVIILDNSDVKDYKTGIEFLISKGFNKLDFWGIQAGYFNKTCTSFFYKSDNCLGI